MMEGNVVDLVDRLLDVIRYEIDRMRDLGEDTTSLENQLREFRKREKDLFGYVQAKDDPSVKLFLSELLEFSKNVHRYYQDVKSGKHLAQELVETGKEKLEEEKEKTQELVSETYDLIENEDYLLDQEFGSKSESQAKIMDTNVPEVDEETKSVEGLIQKEKALVEKLKKEGKDTLDIEFKISRQESLLISMKEALVEGDTEKALEIKKQIEEIGRTIL